MRGKQAERAYRGTNPSQWFPCVLGMMREILPPASWRGTLGQMRARVEESVQLLTERLQFFVKHAPGGGAGTTTQLRSKRSCQTYRKGTECQFRKVPQGRKVTACAADTDRRVMTCALSTYRFLILEFLAVGRHTTRSKAMHDLTWRLHRDLLRVSEALGPRHATRKGLATKKNNQPKSASRSSSVPRKGLASRPHHAAAAPASSSHHGKSTAGTVETLKDKVDILKATVDLAHRRSVPMAMRLMGANSVDDARRAYHALSLRVHPDKNPDDASATDRFSLLQMAYEMVRGKGKSTPPPSAKKNKNQQKKNKKKTSRSR